MREVGLRQRDGDYGTTPSSSSFLAGKALGTHEKDPLAVLHCEHAGKRIGFPENGIGLGVTKSDLHWLASEPPMFRIHHAYNEYGGRDVAFDRCNETTKAQVIGPGRLIAVFDREEFVIYRGRLVGRTRWARRRLRATARALTRKRCLGGSRS